MLHNWKVVPISEGQRKDVRPEDLIMGGLYRRCETYRGGGGYDQFPALSKKYFGKEYSTQFIVQLYGCSLFCPYCYVTMEGIWGEFTKRNSFQLVQAFKRAKYTHNTNVFHLMGGAPALQMKFWPELMRELTKLLFEYVFHSDFVLNESIYDTEILKEINRLSENQQALFAVDIKGFDEEELLKNTRKNVSMDLIKDNIIKLEQSEIPLYYTFTNVSLENIQKFWYFMSVILSVDKVKLRQNEAFSIDLIDYDAAPYIDRIPWGGLDHV